MLHKILTIALLFVVTLLLMALQKPLFLLWYAERAAEASTSDLLGVMWHGLLLDSTTAGYISVIPWLIMLAAVWVKIPERVMQRLMTAYFAVMAFIVALIVAVDMGLFRHWSFRLDSTIIPYLRTPKEAAASVTWSDLWPTILLLFGYGALLFFMWRPIAKIYHYAKQAIAQRITSTLR